VTAIASSISLRRRSKRVLLSVGEFGILILGFYLSLFSGAIVAFAFEFAGESAVGWGFLCGAILGLVLTVVGFRAVRRKNRPWKIEYEADRRELERAERKTHPTRARCKRIAKRVLVCMPSLVAALVLFFFPVATHIVHLRAHYLGHYRVPIPWNLAVFSSPEVFWARNYVWALARSDDRARFGVTSYGEPSSAIEFGFIDPDYDAIRFNARYSGSWHPAAQEFSRDFRLNGVAFRCWQYQYGHFGGGAWSISCKTPLEARWLNLYAGFLGREEDIPIFYRIIEGITPVH